MIAALRDDRHAVAERAQQIARTHPGRHHDGIRGVTGTFDATVQALDEAAELGIPVQVNTLVASQTADDLPAVYDLLRQHTLMRWSLFFLISVGRGTQLEELAPVAAERLMRWLQGLNAEAPFPVKTVEANLSRVYRKLALRSRADLVRRLAAEVEDVRP